MRQSRAGYSLFEVLIAFAILAMVLSVLIPGQARYLIRLRPEHRNHVWSYDFVHCRTDDGKVFRTLNILDDVQPRMSGDQGEAQTELDRCD